MDTILTIGKRQCICQDLTANIILNSEILLQGDSDFIGKIVISKLILVLSFSTPSNEWAYLLTYNNTYQCKQVHRSYFELTELIVMIKKYAGM